MRGAHETQRHKVQRNQSGVWGRHLSEQSTRIPFALPCRLLWPSVPRDILHLTPFVPLTAAVSCPPQDKQIISPQRRQPMSTSLGPTDGKDNALSCPRRGRRREGGRRRGNSADVKRQKRLKCRGRDGRGAESDKLEKGNKHSAAEPTDRDPNDLLV